jgi:hypothetical protein
VEFRNTYDYGRMLKFKDDASSLKKTSKKASGKVKIYPDSSYLGSSVIDSQQSSY